jgi:hypothetical protein
MYSHVFKYSACVGTSYNAYKIILRMKYKDSTFLDFAKIGRDKQRFHTIGLVVEYQKS